MPLLQVRDFPGDIYEEIAFEARAQNRTIAQETIVLIKKGLGEALSNRDRRRMAFEQLKSIGVPKEARDVDLASLIHEMREERTDRILKAAGVV